MEESKIILELSIHEAEILRMALQGHNPSRENEMITVILFHKIKTKIAEAIDKNEQL